MDDSISDSLPDSSTQDFVPLLDDPLVERGSAAGGGPDVPVGDVCQLSGISSQQKLGNDIQKIEEVLGRGLPNDDARKQLFDELNQIRESLKERGFLQKIADSYRKPLHDVSERLLLPKIKEVLRAPQNMDEKFENNLKYCLNALMSATNYYIKLLFKSFYNDSKIRVLFGSACTIIELQVAYSALCYILNNATFVLSVGSMPDIRALSVTFTAAYSAMNEVNIIAFLTSYGYTSEQAKAIYATIAAVSIEQGKFILKGIFLRGVNRFENEENPGGAAAAPQEHPQERPPSFLQFITEPSRLFGRVMKAVPLPKLHLMIGEPGAAVSAVAVDKFQRFVGVVEDTVLRQLRTAFPDDADDILVDILFKLLLGLDDEDYNDEDKFNIKLGFFIQKLKDCLKAKYGGMTDEQFQELCKENLPGLNKGLTEDIILRIYGPHEEISDSLKGQPSYSQQQDPGEPPFKTKVLEVFKTATLRVWEHFTCFLGAITPEQVAPPKQIEVSELEHPVLKLNNYIEDLKRENPDLNNDKLEICFESFKRTIHIKTTDHGKVYVTTENPEKPNDFGAACKDLYETFKGIGVTAKDAKDKLASFFERCFTVGYIVCNISSDLALPIPFGGNSVGASTAMADTYMNMFIKAQEKMIRQQQAAAAGEQVEADADPAGEDYEMIEGGGQSRRKSRKNTKRTRRYSKGRKSSKAAKKTQQRRSSRYRRSSRKGRK